MKAPVLFFSAVLAQAGAVPSALADPVTGAVSGDLFKWMVQSGSFAALFVVMATIAIRWLAANTMASKDQTIQVLTENVRGNAELAKSIAETNARTALVLERVDKTLERFERTLNAVVDQHEDQRKQDERNHRRELGDR